MDTHQEVLEDMAILTDRHQQAGDELKAHYINDGLLICSFSGNRKRK